MGPALMPGQPDSPQEEETDIYLLKDVYQLIDKVYIIRKKTIFF